MSRRLSSDSRLKARPDVYFVRADDGVWLRNHSGSFFVRGPQSYELVRSLLTSLDGKRTTAELCSGFTPERREALQRRLLQPLLARGFLYELPKDAKEAPAWMLERYSAHLAYLEQYVTDPVERLEAVRSTSVVCVGSGLLLRSMATALFELGIVRVQVFAQEPASAAKRLDTVVATASVADSEADWRLQLLDPAAPLTELVATIRLPTGAVVVLASTAPHAEIAAAGQMLGARGHAVAVMAPVGEFVVSSPILGHDWCWECLYRCIMSTQDVSPAPPSAAFGALQVAQRVFCRIAGALVPEDRHVTLVESRTLSVRTASPRRHFFCRQPHHRDVEVRPLVLGELDDAPVRPDFPTSQDDEELTSIQNRIVSAISSLVDSASGPLLAAGEEDLTQMPLAGSRCLLQDPRSMPGAPSTSLLTCRALSAREARNQAALFGFERLMGVAAPRLASLRGALALGCGWSLGESGPRRHLARSRPA